MRKYLIISIIGLGLANTTNAQTGIETKITSPSAVLEFASGTTKGIILPAVQTLPASPANGTFLFDAGDAEKKIKMFENGGWVALSGTGNTTNIVSYSGLTDNNKKTVMGALESNADGVLVLESTNKALVLPKVSNPHLTVKSPYPGMMCYDTDRNALAVFDGTVWNYWK